MPKAVKMQCLDSSAILNRVIFVMANWKICIELISFRLPTGHDVHIQQQSMGNCLQMCRPTTHTLIHHE